LPDLLKDSQTRGLFIAVHGEQVVGKHSDELQLSREMRVRYPEEFVLVRRVCEEALAAVHIEEIG
jgi:hypothetical protein